ncbi:hypothetical protein [Sporosarcina beigongshangi]|uniref:hypothetical protein n=1 Tax=Sporosarcina beigongshangi TaxID=2782538 RepID=UPI0019399E84|nr:hypothetical protein [Sporosarcina beigongshangi]
MRPDKKQGGYTLLLTLVLLILFTALGFSLVALTSSGIAKNAKRQDITQSATLSEMGIDRMTKQINSELTAALGESGLGRGAFISELEKLLNKYKCSGANVLEQTNSTGTFEVCINNYIDTKDDKGEDNPLRKLVYFTSIGATGNSTRTLASEIEIGAELVPETLKYAIGTNILSKTPKNGEGNLLLHGGVEVQGDMKVDGNIITRDRGYAFLGGKDQWIASLSPSAKPTIGVKTAKLVLGKNAYTLDANESYSTHIARTDFPSGNRDNYTHFSTSNISSLFRTGHAPQVVRRDPVRSPIGIGDQQDLYKYSRTAPGVTTLITNSNRVIQSQSRPNGKVFPSYLYMRNGSCIKRDWNYKCTEYEQIPMYEDNGTYELVGTNSFKQFSTFGNLTIKQDNSNITVKEGLYIEGDLTIGNTSANQNTNVSNYVDVTIDGPIFVNGKVTIRGANLKSNALIYVNSDSDSAVDIQYSTMNGKALDGGKSGSFIIFSRGNVKISNNSVNQDDPSHIKGFFYSEKDLEIFGVGSNIKIEGGISARRIVLNAIRGKSSYSYFTGSQVVASTNFFEGMSNQQNKDSRLQILYDPEIIATYSDLKQQEPIIYKVDPPLETNRSY